MKKGFESNTMSEQYQEESYYELLKVDPRATVAEIVSAYHTAKNAFSKDSVATYSLFTAEEAEQMLARLEEAYLTLSNISRRAEYDKKLTQGHSETPLRIVVNNEMPAGFGEPEAEPSLKAPLAEVAAVAPEVAAAAVAESVPEAVATLLPDEISGATLLSLREKRGLSLEDVCRITKIPGAFLKAIEGDHFKKLPARVYIQGFIKNMAVLYKIDPKSTAKGYLSYLDRVHPPVA